MQIEGHEIDVRGRVLRIARIDGEKFTFPTAPEEAVEAIRAAGLGVDLFTFIQRPPIVEPLYPFHMERDNFAMLPISTYENWWNNQIQSLARNRARQAEKKGVAIREISLDRVLLEGIVGIHNETPIRQGRRFPHFGMDVEGARKYSETFVDRSIFIGAFLGDRMIGFLKMVMADDRGHASIINILSLISERDKAPTNAMIAQAVRSCADRSIPYLMYENFIYGQKENDGLTKFKEVNGFRRMDLPRYYIPISVFGKMALKIGMHRRIVDYCPELIASKLRDLRTAWYVHTLKASYKDS